MRPERIRILAAVLLTTGLYAGASRADQPAPVGSSRADQPATIVQPKLTIPVISSNTYPDRPYFQYGCCPNCNQLRPATPVTVPGSYYQDQSNQYSGCTNCNQQQESTKGLSLKQRWDRFTGKQPQPCGCAPSRTSCCSDWHEECQFLFGSCRNFFGDPCYKAPQDLLMVSEREYAARTLPQVNHVNKVYP